jgi:GNAT superfamily N-acetyltransferase
VDLSIREATAAEADEIAAVRVAAADDLTVRFGKGLWSSNATANGVLFAMKRGRVIVAVREGVAVGTLTLSTYKPWAIDKSYFTRVKTPIYLTSMAIAPNAQGQGVGRAMLNAETRTRDGRAGPAMRSGSMLSTRTPAPGIFTQSAAIGSAAARSSHGAADLFRAAARRSARLSRIRSQLRFRCSLQMRMGCK